MMKLCQSVYTRATYSLGKMLREAGYGIFFIIELDRRGCYKTKDISYLEPTSRHRTVLNLYDNIPVFPSNTFVASSACLIGSVLVGQNSSIWYGAILRGDLSSIRIGNNVSIGTNSVLITQKVLAQGVPSSINIGNDVVIEDGVTINGCIIDDQVYIGTKSVIGEGVIIERGASIGSNCVVPPGVRIPAGEHWGGSPLRQVENKIQRQIMTEVKEHQRICLIQQ